MGATNLVTFYSTGVIVMSLDLGEKCGWFNSVGDFSVELGIFQWSWGVSSGS